METRVIVDFYADYYLKNKLEEFFYKYGIQLTFPEKRKHSSEVYVEVPINLNERLTVDTLARIISTLESEFNLSCGEALSFKFDDEDFKQLRSTGNSPKVFLEHKKDGVEWITLCKYCGLQAKVQTSALVIDTSKIRDRYMVNVGVDYWVVSEKMALLMEKWDITGYKLQEVIHSGKKTAQTAFQILPTNILPSWSSVMKHYYFITETDDQCSICNIRGRIDYPYHYNKTDIEKNPIKDINILQEWKSNGQWAYHSIFFSKRFRDLLIDNGITRDVRNMYDNNYKSKDWLFDPVIIVD